MKAQQTSIIPISGRKLALSLALVASLVAGCDRWPHDRGEGVPVNHVGKYPSDIAVTWINLQQDLTKTTSGFDPLVAARAFAYSGLTLYESVVKGMPGYRSVASPRIGKNIHTLYQHELVFWPASVNAAMASILRNLYANTSDSNKQRIDSLETSLQELFAQKVPPNLLSRSAEYGADIAKEIFEWTKTDGGHEAYLSATNDNYIPPTGPGLWIPTPPASGKPVRPYWGSNRSFVANSANITMPPPPPAYSENTTSGFYYSVNAVYQKSVSLTDDEKKTVNTWGDIPGNYGTSGHYTNIATQLIQENNFRLDNTALTYAKHGIAIYEATISVFKAKYKYNLIRPISYIRLVIGDSQYNSVINTPPHPEYPSAHATIGGASFTVLESIFGKNYSFTDRTHENTWGARSYSSLRAYAMEASHSRFLGGIHYDFSANIGLAQGEHVGSLVNKIPFK